MTPSTFFAGVIAKPRQFVPTSEYGMLSPFHTAYVVFCDRGPLINKTPAAKASAAPASNNYRERSSASRCPLLYRGLWVTTSRRTGKALPESIARWRFTIWGEASFCHGPPGERAGIVLQIVIFAIYGRPWWITEAGVCTQCVGRLSRCLPTLAQQQDTWVFSVSICTIKVRVSVCRKYCWSRILCHKLAEVIFYIYISM